MDEDNVCSVCGTTHSRIVNFCTECGCNLTESSAISVTITPDKAEESKMNTIRDQVQNISNKAQRGLSGVTSVISDKAKDVTGRATNIVVEEKVSEAMGNLVNLMINVSRDIAQQIPTEMVDAIDLKADVNFVAFTIGVVIDLAEIRKSNKKGIIE